MEQPRKRITLARVEAGQVTDQQLFWEDEPLPEGETWLPIVVENPDYSRLTHYEVMPRKDVVESGYVRRVRNIQPIEVTIEMVKAECQRRIILATGGGDIIGSFVKQLNDTVGLLKPTILKIRKASDKIEAMQPIPIDFRDDKWWTQGK